MRAQRIPRLSLQLLVLDILLTPVGLCLSALLRIVLPFGKGMPTEAAWLPIPVYPLAVLCWSAALGLSGVYDPQRVLRWFNEAARVVWASVIATMLLAGVLYMTYRDVSRLQFAYFFAVNLGLLLAFRAGFRIYYRAVGRARPGARSRVLIVGAGDLGRRVARALLDHSRWGFDLIGYLDDNPALQGQSLEAVPVLGKVDGLSRLVEGRKVDEVWVALPVRAYERLNQIVLELERLPVRIMIVPDYFSLAMVRAKAEVFGGIPVIGLREPMIEGLPRLMKRVFDILVSAVNLIVLAPLMAAIALMIRLESPGPVIFRQKRVGENGRLFDMFKFRTMVPEAERMQPEVILETEAGQVIHKRRDDPRLTRAGRFLRRYSLDELPQLANVLLGSMSLVGPRPEMPWLVDKYEPWQRKRFAVPQGLTGWWQINGRSDKPMHLNTADDLYYVYNYSLWLDIQILLRTPLVVLQGRGAF